MPLYKFIVNTASNPNTAIPILIDDVLYSAAVRSSTIYTGEFRNSADAALEDLDTQYDFANIRANSLIKRPINYASGHSALFTSTFPNATTLNNASSEQYLDSNLYFNSVENGITTQRSYLLLSNSIYDIPIYEADAWPYRALVNMWLAPSAVINNPDSLTSYNLYSIMFGLFGFSLTELRAQITTANRSTYTSTEIKRIKSAIDYIKIDYDPTQDPYTDIIPESTTGGGNGTGDFTDETIGEPSLPSVSALNSGFISAYVPSTAQLNALASYMWTSDFADNLKKVFGDNPMNTILGLSSVPLQAPTGGTNNVVLGNIDTGVAMPRLSNQYKKVSCGSITLAPKYNAFLDYEPYTSIDLYLPYIGMVQLSTNDCMGKSISVTYTVDILTGACVANVACGGSIMYTFNGACATQMPVTNNDYSNVFKSAIDAATSIVGAVAGGVAGAMTGNVAGAATAIVDGVAGAANAAMNAHPTVNRSGGLAGSAGLMAVQRPFIVWTCPKMVAANGQNGYIGYPIFATYTLGNLSGYTEVENINLGIAGATNEELAEIKTLLKNGVIL